MSDDTIPTETVEVTLTAEVRVPTEGGFSFDPLAHEFANGEIDGTRTTLKATSVRAQPDVLVEFGTLGPDGQPGVFFDTNELLFAALDALEATGKSLPEDMDDE